MTYCPRNETIVYAQKKTLYLCKINSGGLKKKIPFSTTIKALAIDETESRIAVACYNYLYILDMPFDDQSWKVPTFVTKYEHSITDLSFYPNNMKCLLISFNNGLIRLVNIEGTEGIKETSILADSICFISNDRFVVASSQDSFPGTIIYKDLVIRKTIIGQELVAKLKKSYGISYDDNDFVLCNKKKIYSLSSDEIYIFEAFENAIPKEKRCSVWYLSNFRCCFKTISPNGRRALYAFKDGTMFLVDVITGKSIKLLEKTNNHSLIHSACFSSDSQLIATTSNEGKVRVYNAKDGTLIQRMKPIQTLWGNSIEFSQKGDMIICASQDYFVYVWEFDKDNKLFKQKITLSGHEEGVCCASFSSDGKMAVSASPGKIIVWDVESGIPLEKIELDTKGHDLNFVKFNPDDTRIFVSRDGKLTVIEFPKLQMLVDSTRKRFRNRKLSEQERKLYYLE